MRKNKPAATKGFSPFKENKSSNRTGDKNRTQSGDRERPAGKDFKRGGTDRPTRPAPAREEENKAFRPKFQRSGEDRKDSGENKRSPIRVRIKPKEDDNKGFQRSDDDRGNKRPPGRVRTTPKDDDKKGFQPRARRSDDDRGDKRPAGRAHTAPKRDDDNSSFHGDFQPGSDRKGNRPSRETPSGFNRKKFFDRTNERFAEKQARKSDPTKRKPDNKNIGSKGRKTEEAPGSSEGMPLNKYIAHTGLCSRRKAVDVIKEGKVTVNDKPVLEPAFKVTDKDRVKIANKPVSLQKNLVYILLNKPKGFITTTDDPEGRQTVMELIQDATSERVFPVGRLDRNTSGLLLLTNDGELAQKLAHPKHNIKKIYQVGLDKPLTKAHFDQIIAGVTLEDGVALVDALGYVDSKDRTQVGIEIHSGKNRIVRRIFEHLEYQVEKLDRVMYAGLTKKNVNRGRWRLLTEKEVILLKHFK
ncbi:pseudouridine synthase [Chitinophaga sp. GbtcB8]|uniref:pseudouridine synthase n=1 Tax=Chitinophaga sp. GbtcB8 TaxID=2824753 RepID=UPI0020C6AD6F|nr:pseudouridine synthase [Chitinophaga sp. GbtcB8]